MLALVVVDTFCVVLLAVLVVGLLRSHADILRALHSLGAGVGDPVHDAPAHPGDGAGRRSPVTMGPPLSPGRSSASVHDVSGVTPDGDALSVAVASGAGSTLLVFLSSGCTTCAEIWGSITTLEAHGLSPGIRVVVVTKGPELEVVGEVRRNAPPGVLTVMSTAAWSDYEVPGSPFFVLVDGATGRRLGEGMAGHVAQVADLVRRARADESPPGGAAAVGLEGLGGPAREARNDGILAASGILPGDPSLYPKRLDDVFSGAAAAADADAATAAPSR